MYYTVSIIDQNQYKPVHYQPERFANIASACDFVKAVINSISNNYYSKAYYISMFGKMYNIADFRPLIEKQIAQTSDCEFYFYIGLTHKHRVYIKKIS